MITASIDISGMETVLRGLSVATMKPMKDVTTAEAVSILQTCMDRTELTPAKTIISSLTTKFNQYAQRDRWGSRSQGFTPKISIAPNKGNVWFVRPVGGIGKYSRSRKGGVVCLLVNKNNVPDEIWNDYQSMEQDRIHNMARMTTEWLARRGIPRAAWYQLAEGMGHALKAAKDVHNATVRGKRPDLAVTTIEQDANSFTLVFSNQSIASINKDAAGILQRTINGRIKYFERNLEKGVFDSMKHVEHAYPNLVKLRAA